MNQSLKLVLEYPKLVKYLEQNPTEVHKVSDLVDEIHGNFNVKMMDYVAKLLESTFLKLYDSIDLGVPDQFDLHDLYQKYHIVFVPNHQSHADYLALNYLLYKRFKLPIYIAGGINLNIFPIGKLFRNAGAFFIRRSFGKDLLYKNVFEAYVYSLLREDKMVEFFFEGGRSRTGKLLPPKFGLFQMLLEAHSHLATNKPLMFLPVSITHEHVPEEKAHERELGGEKKRAESPSQIFKIFRVVNKKMGSIYIRIGEGIIVDKVSDLKEDTQKIAFKCFNEVGQSMPVTPTSVLALVMLDEPAGAMTWEHIETKALDVIEHCRQFNIPLAPSLSSDLAALSLSKALNNLIENKKIQVLDREKLNQIFYSIKREHRIKMLYAKNMILHHFLVPCMMSAAWINLFNGSIANVAELNRFLQSKRRELRFEFYLPTVKEMFKLAMSIVSYALGRRVSSLEECLKLSPTELYKIASKVSYFATGLTYIYEAYYIAACTLRHFGVNSFQKDKFLAVAKELHQMEMEHGRVVKYMESYAVPIIGDSLSYFKHMGLIKEDLVSGEMKVVDLIKLEEEIDKFAKDINDQIVIHLKFSKRR